VQYNESNLNFGINEIEINLNNINFERSVPPQLNPQTTFLNENDTYAITDSK